MSGNLHPLFADILALHGIAPQQPHPGLPETYRARVGRRRVFMSLADAAAYEAGYAAFPCGPIPAMGTPASTGYFDAESAYLDRVDNSDRVRGAA